MDFTQKIIDKRREVQELCTSETARKAMGDENGEGERFSEAEVPPPQNPDEEWLVIVS